MEFIQERQIIQLYNTSSASNMYDKVSLSHTSNTRNTSNARIQELQIITNYTSNTSKDNTSVTQFSSFHTLFSLAEAPPSILMWVFGSAGCTGGPFYL